MKTYISILRGVNVSGKHIIKMEMLQKMYERLGFDKVQTYVQSGNVIFGSEREDPTALAQTITQQIGNDFGFDVPVIVIPTDQLEQIIRDNPLLDESKDPAFMHVTFLSSTPQTSDSDAIEAKRSDGEEFSVAENAVYLYCPNGYGKTKLNNTFLEAKLKVSATTRSWKTTNQLLNMAQQNIE